MLLFTPYIVYLSRRIDFTLEFIIVYLTQKLTPKLYIR